jgi:opacity protein-like surface antigen
MKCIIALTLSTAILASAAASPALADWRGRGYYGGYHSYHGGYHHRGYGWVGPGVALGLGLGVLGGALLYNRPPVYYVPPPVYYPPRPYYPPPGYYPPQGY